jgi:uncharacterized protein (TIGR00661 family)
MIIDDQIRILIQQIETSQDIDPVALIKELIQRLHANCELPATQQRYKDYANKKFSIGQYPIAEDGYAVAFDPLTQEREFWNCWYSYGVVVSSQVISPERAQQTIIRMREILLQLSDNTFDVNVPATYNNIPKDSNGVPFMSRGFVEIYHDDYLAQLRQAIRVYIHYVVIWGRVDLWSTFDRMGLKLPEHPESEALPLHVDQNYTQEPHHHMHIQGVLALVDCKERGTLVTVPGSQGLFPEYGQIVAENSSKYPGAYVQLDLTKSFATELINGAQVIPVHAGCLVSWSSGITHANTKNLAKDARMVAYVSMCPANDFDEPAKDARDKAFASGRSSYNHRAGLHVTTKPRFGDANSFRKSEQLNYLGKLLYSREPYDHLLDGKSKKRLLLNAEFFNYGPAAAIADMYVKLRKDFEYIAFIGSKFTYDLQTPTFEAVYIIDEANINKEEIAGVMAHYDLFLTASDFKMAEIAVANNIPTIVYDPLAWYWEQVPEILKDPRILYLAQDFYGVRERLESQKVSYNLTHIVPPLVTVLNRKPWVVRDTVMLNFGGLKNPFWGDVEVLAYASLMFNTVKAVLPADVKLIIAGNKLVAEHLQGKNYTRAEISELLPTICMAFATPGLGNIFDFAANDIPVIYLPPANDSQGLQVIRLQENKVGDAIINWSDDGVGFDHTKSQREIMDQLTRRLYAANLSGAAKEKLKKELQTSYNDVSKQQGSNTRKILYKFGTDGVEIIARIVKSYSRAHRPFLLSKPRPALNFNLPGKMQLSIISNMLNFTDQNIWELQAHIPGLVQTSIVSKKKPIILEHIQTNNNELVLQQTDGKVELFAKYTTQMPADIAHLLYGMVRKHYLEQHLCMVHAACLELADGRNVLIAGNSGVGKSSTALRLVLEHNAKLISGDKTVIRFNEHNRMYAIAGTNIMTLRVEDRAKWPQLNDNKGIIRGDRFVFKLKPEQYASTEARIIDAIFLLTPHGVLQAIKYPSSAHTLYPYFLDTARADVMVGNELFDGSISFAAKQHITNNLKSALSLTQVYQFSVGGGDPAQQLMSIMQPPSPMLTLYSRPAAQALSKKYLFGICGLGSGHTFRQLPIMDALLAQNDSIFIFAYGFALEHCRKYYANNAMVKIYEVQDSFIVGTATQGVDFAASATQAQNAQYSAKINLSALAAIGRPDCVISDYEEISAKCAYALDVPLITVDQQSKYFFGGPIDEVQRLSMFFPKVSKRIALSFFNVPSDPTQANSKVKIMAPIMRKEIIAARGVSSFAHTTILIYSSAMYSLDMDKIDAVLAKFPHVTFINFPNNPDHDFVQTLAKCHGVISTAGHSLLSEAMYLAKPVLAIPDKIYEQQKNATVIGENAFGIKCEMADFDATILADFICRLPEFVANIQANGDVLLGGTDAQPILDEIKSCMEAERVNKYGASKLTLT